MDINCQWRNFLKCDWRMNINCRWGGAICTRRLSNLHSMLFTYSMFCGVSVCSPVWKKQPENSVTLAQPSPVTLSWRISKIWYPIFLWEHLKIRLLLRLSFCSISSSQIYVSKRNLMQMSTPTLRAAPLFHRLQNFKNIPVNYCQDVHLLPRRTHK